MGNKTCVSCGAIKPTGDFDQFVKTDGRVLRYRKCKKCRNRQTYLKRKDDPKRVSKMKYWDKQQKKRLSSMRRSGIDVARFILEDSRKSDNREDRENDLTKEFIAEAVKPGCSYCGETGIRMTLDRKNNDKGHTKDNVVAACIRCNYTKKNMPHAAWMCLVDGMRKAKEAGFFGDWTGRVR